MLSQGLETSVLGNDHGNASPRSLSRSLLMGSLLSSCRSGLISSPGRPLDSQANRQNRLGAWSLGVISLCLLHFFFFFLFCFHGFYPPNNQHFWEIICCEKAGWLRRPWPRKRRIRHRYQPIAFPRLQFPRLWNRFNKNNPMWLWGRNNVMYIRVLSKLFFSFYGYICGLQKFPG